MKRFKVDADKSFDVYELQLINCFVIEWRAMVLWWMVTSLGHDPEISSIKLDPFMRISCRTATCPDEVYFFRRVLRICILQQKFTIFS